MASVTGLVRFTMITLHAIIYRGSITACAPVLFASAESAARYILTEGLRPNAVALYRVPVIDADSTAAIGGTIWVDSWISNGEHLAPWSAQVHQGGRHNTEWMVIE